MQVTYGGFTGELVKLERKYVFPKYDGISSRTAEAVYDLAIYDGEKQATISFSGVKKGDFKFLGGVVTFGG